MVLVIYGENVPIAYSSIMSGIKLHLMGMKSGEHKRGTYTCRCTHFTLNENGRNRRSQ